MMNSIRHFGIVVQDLEKSLQFYRDLLGLEIKRDMMEEGEFIDTILGLNSVKVRTVKMKAKQGDTLVELLRYESPQRGGSHLAFTVENLQAEYERLKNQGIRFISAPQLSPDGKAKVAFCYDPNSVPIELVQEL